MFGIKNARTTISQTDQVLDETVSFEEVLSGLAAEEAYAQDLITRAQSVLRDNAVAFADFASDVDEEIRYLLSLQRNAEAGSARAAYLADATSEPLTLVREPDAGTVEPVTLEQVEGNL